ncbi:MAG: tRNA (adenosine(37)-N6)-threonylcarbamoyltransferase complex transferase subunit TsaD, partial [Verrucomicrobiota bacterium]
GALLVGASFGEALALGLGRPTIGIHHLEGHLLSPLLAANPPAFPFVALLVSGGHTQLMRVDGVGRYELLGETQDDAAGEAFDKGAKLLGLPYPGGALIERLAADGDASRHRFPRGIPERADLRMSFSGLKTALRYQLEKLSDAELEREMPHLCAGYQRAIVDQLTAKTDSALESGRHRSLGISGGVANNASVRSAVGEVARGRGIPLLAAAPSHCGDNAAMVAFAAWADAGLPNDASVTPEAQLAVDRT